jgi:hypothetical protein
MLVRRVRRGRGHQSMEWLSEGRHERRYAVGWSNAASARLLGTFAAKASPVCGSLHLMITTPPQKFTASVSICGTGDIGETADLSMWLMRRPRTRRNRCSSPSRLISAEQWLGPLLPPLRTSEGESLRAIRAPRWGHLHSADVGLFREFSDPMRVPHIHGQRSVRVNDAPGSLVFLDEFGGR